MSNKLFTAKEIDILSRSPYVKTVSEKSISFTNEFKLQFIKLHESGSTGVQIFESVGISPSILGKTRIEQFVHRCKKQYIREEGFQDTRKGNSGRPRVKEETPQEQLKKLQEQIAYLQQENAFLKKVRKLERQVKKNQYQDKNTK